MIWLGTALYLIGAAAMAWAAYRQWKADEWKRTLTVGLLLLIALLWPIPLVVGVCSIELKKRTP